MPNQCKVFYSNSFSPFFDCINKVMLCLFMSKILRIVSDWRESNTVSIKGMYLIMLFQMLKSSDICQSSSSKTMEHDKMRQVFLRVTIRIDFMHMIIFIDLDVSCMQLMLKYKVRKSKSLFVDFISLFCRDLFVFDQKLLFYLTFSQSFYCDLHLNIYFIIFVYTFRWISIKYFINFWSYF